MKKAALWAMILLFIFSASAEGSLSPLPALPVANGQRTHTDYQYSEDLVCDVWAYPMTNDLMTVRLWLVDCIDAGFDVSIGDLEGFKAYHLERDGLRAYLLPEYQGVMLLLIECGIEYADYTAKETETPAAPVVTPAPTYGGSSDPGTGLGYHWEWRSVQVDCPSCVNGYCSTCNGTGTYHFAGQSVPCDIYCKSCGGAGYIIQREYVMVFD